MSVAGVVLAAGAGRRLGQPKALVRLGGELLVERAVRMAREGGCEPVLVVVGSHADEVLAQAQLGAAQAVHADDWDEGMGASLRAGIVAADALGCAAIAVILVDQPRIGPEALRRVISSWEAGATAAVATYDGQPRNPVVLDRSIWADVSANARGDIGARGWLREHPDQVVEVPCDGTGDPVDVDTPLDLDALQEAPVKLENTFTVPVAVDTAWQVLLDVPRIAPCMPGATLTGQEGDSFTGKVKVKLGPISLTYGGTATITSRDDASHVAVIEATGKETRGSGTAKATITARLHEQNGSTEVAVETDLTITGKPAQFGRGVLAEVSGKLITQFADCLAAEITADGAAADLAEESSLDALLDAGSETPPDPPSSPPASPSGGTPPDSAADQGSPTTVTPPPPVRGAPTPVRPAPRPAAAPDSIDLLGTAGGPVLKRLAPVLIVLAAAIAFLLIRRRR